ncbi:terminase TerL endonuclease subunit [Carnobacterium divergens]|uniref:terminase TerL endonuclease subunit n=1 Tax=Carnobacterium divergens TaxID=2748 RepID=UPI0039AFBD14
MIKNKYFDEYKKLLHSGDHVACKEQFMLVEYLEKNILSRDDVCFDEKMMEDYVKFSEKQFFPLAIYQKFIASFVFFYWKNIDRVVFREFLITLGRGGGKNGWMSTLGAFFISPLHGIRNYNATITANSEDQAKMSFDEVFNIIQIRNLEKQYDAKKSAITGRQMNAVFKFRTNNPKTMDSARDGCLFFDEIHQFEDNKPVKVQRSGLGKIKHPRTFYFGTNGYVREGFYDKQIERSMKILEGKTDRIGYFPFICKLDDISEIDKPECWPKANPMFNEKNEYAKQVLDEVKEDYLDLEEEPSGRQEFVIKRMNFTEGDSEKDVTTHEKLLATNQPIPNLKGRSCVAGFDYASIRDFATVGLLFKDDDKFIWMQHSFARKQFLDSFKLKAPIYEWKKQGLVTILDEPSIDPQHLVDWLNEKRNDYKIEMVASDGFRMDLLKPLLDKDGYKPEFFRNPRGVQAKVAPIIEDGFANERFIFGNDPMMRWYTNNTFVKEDGLGNRTFLKKEPVRRKTDGFHAFIAALYKREEISEIDIDGAFDLLDMIDF